MAIGKENLVMWGTCAFCYFIWRQPRHALLVGLRTIVLLAGPDESVFVDLGSLISRSVGCSVLLIETRQHASNPRKSYYGVGYWAPAEVAELYSTSTSKLFRPTVTGYGCEYFRHENTVVHAPVSQATSHISHRRHTSHLLLFLALPQ